MVVVEYGNIVAVSVVFTSAEAGNTIEYRVVDHDGTIKVDWTSSGVIELSNGMFYVSFDATSSQWAGFNGLIQWRGSRETAVEELIINNTMVDIKDLLEGDFVVDNTTNPFEITIYKKGTTNILLNKKLYDVNGNPVTSISTVIGQRKDV